MTIGRVKAYGDIDSERFYVIDYGRGRKRLVDDSFIRCYEYNIRGVSIKGGKIIVDKDVESRFLYG